MNKTSVLIKASYLQLRTYFWIVLGVLAVSVVTNFIISLSVGPDDNKSVSAANLLSLFLLFVGTVLPIAFFKRILNLGATRQQYYAGVLAVYVVCAAAFAALNIVWLQVELTWIRQYQESFNILEIFRWNRFGLAGMFVYQFGAYLLLLSLLNLLFSGLRHIAGWVLCAAFVAAIPIFTSIAPLRRKLADGLLALLFNDSVLAGFGLTFAIACVLLLGGWWFTARRPLT